MITKLDIFIKENIKEKPKYEFGCVMLELPNNEENNNWWNNDILSLIDDNDLYIDTENPLRFGKEKEKHCTIKYGLHDWEFQLSELKKEVESWGPIEISLSNITLFENELFDVVKFDVESDRLHELNKIITDNYPCTDTYPDYHPHCTIAYVKKGMGKKYIKTFEEPYTFICDTVKISGSGGDDRIEMYINTNPSITQLK